MKPFPTHSPIAKRIALFTLLSLNLVFSQTETFCPTLRATGIVNFGGDCGPEGPSPDGTLCTALCVDGRFTGPLLDKTINFTCVSGEWTLYNGVVYSPNTPLDCAKSGPDREYEEDLELKYERLNSNLPRNSTECDWTISDTVSFVEGCSPREGQCHLWCPNGNFTQMPSASALYVTCYKTVLQGNEYRNSTFYPITFDIDCTPRMVSSPTPEPTPQPTTEPTSPPTPQPTPEPTSPPTPQPTPEPTSPPTPQPTTEPTSPPTPGPSPMCPFLRSDVGDPAFSYITCVLEGPEIHGHCFYSCRENYTLPNSEKAIEGIGALLCENGTTDEPKCLPFEAAQCPFFEIPSNALKLDGCSQENVFGSGEKCKVGCSRGRFSAIEAETFSFTCIDGKWMVSVPLGDDNSGNFEEADPVSLLGSTLMQCTEESYCGEKSLGVDFYYEECSRRTIESPEKCNFVCKNGKMAHPLDTKRNSLSKGVVKCVGGEWSVPSCKELEEGLRDNYEEIVSLL